MADPAARARAHRARRPCAPTGLRRHDPLARDRSQYGCRLHTIAPRDSGCFCMVASRSASRHRTALSTSATSGRFDRPRWCLNFR